MKDDGGIHIKELAPGMLEPLNAAVWGRFHISILHSSLNEAPRLKHLTPSLPPFAIFSFLYHSHYLHVISAFVALVSSITFACTLKTRDFIITLLPGSLNVLCIHHLIPGTLLSDSFHQLAPHKIGHVEPKIAKSSFLQKKNCFGGDLLLNCENYNENLLEWNVLTQTTPCSDTSAASVKVSPFILL